MIEQGVRTSYQKIMVDPVARRLGAKVSPNTVTLLAGMFGLLTFPALVIGNHVWSAIVFLALSGYCDTLDGTLARLRQCASSWGSVLDIITDRVVEFTIIMALWAVDPMHRSLLCLCMLGSILICITSFLVVSVFSDKASEKSFYYSPGIMERAEAFLFFAFMMVFPSWFGVLALLFCFLVVLTTVMRLWQFYCQERLQSS